METHSTGDFVHSANAQIAEAQILQSLTAKRRKDAYDVGERQELNIEDLKPNIESSELNIELLWG